MTNRWLRTTLWGAAVLVAVGAGGAAVAAASNDGGRQVLSRAAVDRQLKALPAVSPVPSRVPPEGGPTTAPPAPAPPTKGSPVPAPPTKGSPAPGSPTMASPMPGLPTKVYFLSGTGGTISVACSDGMARLGSWWPASGYRSDDPKEGPATTVSVRFENSGSKDVLESAHCSASGTPILATTYEADDHGHDGPTTPPSIVAPEIPQSSPSADDHGGNGSGGGTDDPAPHH